MKQRIRLLAVAVCLAAWQVACGGSGGGNIIPSPPKPTVTISASPTTITTGQSSKLTWSSTNANACTASGSWSGTSATSGSQMVTPSATGKYTYTLACTGSDGTANASATLTVNPTSQPLAVSVSASPTTVNTGATVTLTATVTGGDGNPTVSWSAPTGTFNPATGLSTTYTAPATVPSPATVTITATATDSTGSATGTASVTVQRVITISVAPNSPIPNDELYSDFGAMIGEVFSCTGCETGDTLNVQSTAGGDTTTTFSQPTTTWSTAFNFVGPGYVPGPISMWVVGSDGAKSNTLLLTFDGSQNVAVQDPSSGEVYYYSAGNGSDGSGEIMKFKPDGTADGSHGYSSGASAIAFDSGTLFLTQPALLTSTINGIATFDAGWNGGLIPISNGEPLAIDAKDGLACITAPTGGGSPNATDVVDCNGNAGLFTVPNIPANSAPTPIRVLDTSHIIVYGRGDQTLRWYTISGTTATASGTLQLSEFTATDANYWKTYPATGGWELVTIGSTIGVMGQVVNSDGTVSQKLALVNNTNQTLTQYVDLPNGTVHITADPTNNAIVAEYPDFTDSPPVTRFERIYVDTGNSVLLQSTSTLVPGAGFLITNDGSTIAVFVEGKADFQPNQ